MATKLKTRATVARMTHRKWVNSVESMPNGAAVVRLERGWVFRACGTGTHRFRTLTDALLGTSAPSVIRGYLLYAEARTVQGAGGLVVLELRRSTNSRFDPVGSFGTVDTARQVARDEYYCEVFHAHDDT